MKYIREWEQGNTRHPQYEGQQSNPLNQFHPFFCMPRSHFTFIAFRVFQHIFEFTPLSNLLLQGIFCTTWFKGTWTRQGQRMMTTTWVTFNAHHKSHNFSHCPAFEIFIKVLSFSQEHSQSGHQVFSSPPFPSGLKAFGRPLSLCVFPRPPILSSNQCAVWRAHQILNPATHWQFSDSPLWGELCALLMFGVSLFIRARLSKTWNNRVVGYSVGTRTKMTSGVGFYRSHSWRHWVLLTFASCSELSSKWTPRKTYLTYFWECTMLGFSKKLSFGFYMALAPLLMYRNDILTFALSSWTWEPENWPLCPKWPALGLFQQN